MARRTGVVTILAIVGAVAVGVLASVGVAGGGKSKSMEAKLIGYEEVPAISTAARGKIKLKIRNGSTGTIDYRLSYSGLTNPATQAHIHFAQEGVNGGIVLWLCDSVANNSPVADTPACPAGNTANKETVSGTLDATDVQAVAAQGIAAGELLEVLAAMKAGVTYANVHTSATATPPGFPGGEIRGQLDRRKHDDD